MKKDANRDIKDAELLLRRLEKTHYEIEQILVDLIKKYAHFSETARALCFLPAFSEFQELPGNCCRDGAWWAESTISSYVIFKKYLHEVLIPMRQYLTKKNELLKTETARGCDRMSENGCTSELCPYDISGTPDELKPCNISKRED